MSRRYPLDPPDSGPHREHPPGTAARAAGAAADGLLAFAEWRDRHRDLSQALAGILLLVLGLLLAFSAAWTDRYLHRGVESGSEAPYVVQPAGKELATNADLRIFPTEDLDSVAQTLSDGGFSYVRQEFSWAQIEPEQGAFDWARYDAIVEALSRYDISVVAVVRDTPDWAAAEDALDTADRPPADPATLETFTATLTSRYVEDEAVPFVQIWDRPNLAAQWGGTPATASDFLPVLAAASNGARSGNAEVTVVTPELAVQSDMPGGLSDLEFLRQLYGIKAEPFFDVVGMRLDGGQLSPDDRLVDPDRINFSRAILYREITLEEGDEVTPVWATSLGWAVGPDLAREQQAEYVIRALDRSWSEWPWMGPSFQWAFLAAEGSPAAPYAIVTPDGSATPLYQRLTSPETVERSRIANTGFTPMDAASITYQLAWQDQHLEGRTFRTTSQTGASMTVAFRGTGLVAFLRSGPEVGNITVALDGEIIPGGAPEASDEWSFAFPFGTDDAPEQLVSGLSDSRHELTITLVGEGELTIGGLVVEREPPFIWPIILLTVSSLLALFFAMRSLVYLVAVRAGHLQRHGGIELWPQLPQMPDWRPGRRV